MNVIRGRTSLLFHLVVLLLSVSLFACRSKADQAYERGKTLAKQGSNDEAIAEFKKAIELNPDHAKAYVRMGEVYRTKGDIEEALKSFQTSIEKDPQSLRGYEKLIKTLRDMGKLTEARDACFTALRSPVAQSEQNKQELEDLLKGIEDSLKQAKPNPQGS